jgi:hypothetical protein
VLSTWPRLATISIYSPTNEYSRWPLHWPIFETTGCAGRTDRTCCTASVRPAPSTCPLGFNHGHPISTIDSALQRSNATGHVSDTDRTRSLHITRTRETSTGRVRLTNRTPQCQRPVVSSKHPLMTGCVRSIMTGRAPRPIDLAICCSSRCLTGCAGPAIDRTRRLN